MSSSIKLKKCVVCSRLAYYKTINKNGTTAYLCGYHKHKHKHTPLEIHKLEPKTYYTPTKAQYWQSERGIATRKRYQSNPEHKEQFKAHIRQRYKDDEEYREKRKRESREYYAKRIKPVKPTSEQEKKEFRERRADEITNQFIEKLKLRDDTKIQEPPIRFRQLKGPKRSIEPEQSS